MKRVPFPMAMLAVAAVLTAADVDGQRWRADTADAAFDVASIKRTQPGARPMSMGVPPGQIALRPGGRLAAPSVTVRDLVRIAYDVAAVQVTGGPAWAVQDRFDIEATTRPDVTADEARGMLRRLLRDRFRLQAHDDTRELSVTTLETVREDRRLGPQLRRSGAECAPVTPPPFLAALPPPPPPPPSGPGAALILSLTPFRCLTMTITGHLSMRGVTMALFAGRLGAMLERMVVDRTGLDGDFDLDLTYAPDPGTSPPMVNGVAVTIDAPALPSALREQLGLKLETSRTPVAVMVIDGVAPPTEN
jgi:uncharacterized protein (TIGR03435 family)